ncbi:MAG: hypothetical protein J6P72_07835, partial [Firmicutes bacterium]|nr:hypothetical protein [Bacillota bacterium]
AAELAMKSYGEGDRVPLARILNIGIKKLNMEAEDKTPGQKECLREMATRLVRMISRDPELEKYVQREGLTQEDMENAKNIGTEKEKIRNDQMERTESLISLD